MKELSIEEKAKAYDGNYKAYAELINRLEAVKDAIKKLNYGIAIDVMSKPYHEFQVTTHSELKESEGERIRKDIVEAVELHKDFTQVRKEHIYAWLKKQCEQKPPQEIEPTPIFRIGDVLKRKGKDYTFRVDRIQGGYYHSDRNHGAYFPIEDQDNWELVEQKPDWTPMDEQRVENLLAIIEGHGYPGEVAWLNSLKDRIQSKQGEQNSVWSKDDETTKNNISHIIKQYDKISKRENQPCYYVGDCLLWVQNIKDRVQPQSKQEWGEEDDELYNDLSDTYFYNDEDYPEETYKLMLKRVLVWMTKRAKSLRPQSTWKPSELQINTLRDAIVYVEGCNSNFKGSGSVLENLYIELKKLKE